MMVLTLKRFHGPRLQRDGAAAAEFAVALPLLVTIVLGCVDFGRFAHGYIAVTNAARVGADYASRHRYTTKTQATWNDEIYKAIKGEICPVDEITGVPLTNFDPTKLTVPAPVVTTDPNGLVRVKVEVQYQFKTIVNWPKIPSQVTLKRSVEMRRIL